MTKSRLLACLAVTAAAVAVVPATANAVTACSNQWQFAPDFVTLGDHSYFRAGDPATESSQWMYRFGISAPVAILTSSLPGPVRRNPLWQTYAGDYTLVCNPNGNLPDLHPTATSHYVDDNGERIPAKQPWLSDAGKAIPGLHEVWTVG